MAAFHFERLHYTEVDCRRRSREQFRVLTIDIRASDTIEGVMWIAKMVRELKNLPLGKIINYYIHCNET